MALGSKIIALLGAAYGAGVVQARYGPRLPILDFFSSHPFVLWGLTLLIWSTYSMVIWPRYVSPLRHLPTAPGGNLVLGQLPTLIREPSGVPQQRWNQELGHDGVFRYIWAFGMERIVFTSPKALSEVLVTKNYDFIKPSNIREGIGKLLGIGILLAEGDEHKQQRKLMMPAFAFRHIKEIYPIFWLKGRESVEAISAELAKSLNEDGSTSNIIEVGEWSSRTTLDIIGVAGMGKDFNAIRDPSDELYQTYRKVFQPNRAAQLLGLLRMFMPRIVFENLPTKRHKEVEIASKTIRQVCRDLIQAKRHSIEKDGNIDVDILSVLLKSGAFDDEQIVNQLMTFLAAGHETTASAMMWAVYWLVKNPEIQARLRDEIRQNLPSLSSSDATITSTEIDRLQYLSAVCNEILRLTPPVALTMRSVARDTTIQGQFIPKGATVILTPQVVNLDKSQWGEDAEEFNPDRWMAPGKANSGGASSNFSYLTFLHGPRSCIGQSFAKAEFACLLATWVGRWHMELADPDFKLDIAGGITQKPRGGLKVKLTTIDGW